MHPHSSNGTTVSIPTNRYEASDKNGVTHTVIPYVIDNTINSITISSDKKFQTLLPAVNSSITIEHELKTKLNYFAFNFSSVNAVQHARRPNIVLTHSDTTSWSLKQERSRDKNCTMGYLLPPTPMATPTISPSVTPVSTPAPASPISSFQLLSPSPSPSTQMKTISTNINNKTWQEKITTNKQPIVIRIKKHKKVTKKKQPTRRSHICKTCSMGFTTSGHLSRHNRIHTGEKNHSCPYKGCNQKFSRHDNCLQHYRTHLKKKK
ncbi:Nrg2p NDAI_0A07470 [Naumovozyma dairenensis CBS 421]|uniref:C2H2-type domain-containing protein n=1 Tax=Naumovozyma dairenensis (strain ATCC 10597 / BCRC 20456 / CBS 421 / NBRC 0211 / NRRL Y-12639) TaxID=1071378 RepID=G0W513_NAUDC|nr:hypothetical protein NDAI_0A07470 [Naumovozyma dairenensis CBS 421]CCD22901.1 hypothetical protein NDAI_0A07470 [Naumovozyma dairenensis CBS 421]